QDVRECGKGGERPWHRVPPGWWAACCRQGRANFSTDPGPPDDGPPSLATKGVPGRCFATRSHPGLAAARGGLLRKRVPVDPLVLRGQREDDRSRRRPEADRAAAIAEALDPALERVHAPVLVADPAPLGA